MGQTIKWKRVSDGIYESEAGTIKRIKTANGQAWSCFSPQGGHLITLCWLSFAKEYLESWYMDYVARRKEL